MAAELSAGLIRCQVIRQANTIQQCPADKGISISATQHTYPYQKRTDLDEIRKGHRLGKSFFREQLGSEAIPGFDQPQQKVAIPNVSMTKLVRFSFCQDQRLDRNGTGSVIPLLCVAPGLWE